MVELVHLRARELRERCVAALKSISVASQLLRSQRAYRSS
jgi:hypothetical protein